MLRYETNASKIKSEIMKEAKWLFETQDHEVTCFVSLGGDKKYHWAVVLAWMDYDNNDNWKVYGKVAFQSNNSIMQEYDIDWDMPYDEETGDVFDTEVSISLDGISQAADDLVSYWKNGILPGLMKAEEESKYMGSKCLMTEEKFDALVLDYMLEGKTLSEAIALAEDTITPETITKIEQTPAYKKLQKDIEYYFKAVDGIDGYRDGDFKKNPVQALQGEADFCGEVADFLGSLNFRGFDKSKQKELMQDTAKDMAYLDDISRRFTKALKKKTNDMYLKPDGSVDPLAQHNSSYGDYARRALRKIRDLFTRLGQKWDYDPDFDYKSLPDVDYSMYVSDSKTVGIKSMQSKVWKNDIMNVVNTAITEGIYDKSVLLNMAEDLSLNEEQKDFHKKYVYYILG